MVIRKNCLLVSKHSHGQSHSFVNTIEISGCSIPKHSMNVWYILSPHLGSFGSKCRYIHHGLPDPWTKTARWPLRLSPPSVKFRSWHADICGEKNACWKVQWVDRTITKLQIYIMFPQYLQNFNTWTNLSWEQFRLLSSGHFKTLIFGHICNT